MEWTQFIVMFSGMIGLFAWNRAESRSDARHMDNKIDAIGELTYAIHSEMKDFHIILCSIEERSKKINYNIGEIDRRNILGCTRRTIYNPGKRTRV